MIENDHTLISAIAHSNELDIFNQ